MKWSIQAMTDLGHKVCFDFGAVDESFILLSFKDAHFLFLCCTRKSSPFTKIKKGLILRKCRFTWICAIVGAERWAQARWKKACAGNLRKPKKKLQSFLRFSAFRSNSANFPCKCFSLSLGHNCLRRGSCHSLIPHSRHFMPHFTRMTVMYKKVKRQSDPTCSKLNM